MARPVRVSGNARSNAPGGALKRAGHTETNTDLGRMEGKDQIVDLVDIISADQLDISVLPVVAVECSTHEQPNN